MSLSLTNGVAAMGVTDVDEEGNRKELHFPLNFAMNPKLLRI